MADLIERHFAGSKGNCSAAFRHAAATAIWANPVGGVPRAVADRSEELEEQRHRQWTRATPHSFGPIALPGGYPNLLAGGDADRVAKSYGCNAERLTRAKRQYDPDNVFRSAIPLPVGRDNL